MNASGTNRYGLDRIASAFNRLTTRRTDRVRLSIPRRPTYAKAYVGGSDAF